jgi:arylsulfatase A-like enzyme
LLALVLQGCGKETDFNLLVITIDTLRADHLTCYGYDQPTSPHIDAFATRGVLFETVCCQSSQTLPSHASILAGTNPRSHKAISHESMVDESVTTLAEMLKKRGYLTAAFISSHALDSKYRLDQGFDVYWEVHKERSLEQRWQLKRNEKDATTEAVLGWLDSVDDDRFFLWIHWFDPHRPYDPPERYAEGFAGSYDGQATSDPDYIMKVWRERIELAPEDVAYLAGRYDGEIAFTDAQVGAILDELDSRGMLENTVVVITSDHGEILYEHEYYFGHDIGLYEECIMIPLIMYFPGLEAAGTRVEPLVQSLDIMPTVLEILGIDPPRHLEGKSLLSLIEGGQESTVDFAFSETFPFPEKCPPRHAVRTHKAKLIWKETRDGALEKDYYDLAADPGERTNLYHERPAPAAHLDSVLTAWIEDGGLHPAPIPTARESGRLRILKSLGYID